MPHNHSFLPNSNTDQSFADAFRAVLANQFALEVMVRALLAREPDPLQVDQDADMYAEAVRANLLGMLWSDEQIESFERSLSGLRMPLKFPRTR